MDERRGKQDRWKFVKLSKIAFRKLVTATGEKERESTCSHRPHLGTGRKTGRRQMRSHLLRTVWRTGRWVCRQTPDWPNSDWWPTASACWWRSPIWPARCRPQRSPIWTRTGRTGRPPKGRAPCTGWSPAGRAPTCCCCCCPWNCRPGRPWRLPRPRLRPRRRRQPLFQVRVASSSAAAETRQHRAGSARSAPAIGGGLFGVVVPPCRGVPRVVARRGRSAAHFTRKSRDGDGERRALETPRDVRARLLIKKKKRFRYP